jgi:uncharacterized protein
LTGPPPIHAAMDSRSSPLGDVERASYLRGIELFNQHHFFEAHEVWEEIWRPSQGSRRNFYQGLIQCAVALEHYCRSNPRGVISLSRSYPHKFHGLPAIFLGMDVRGFVASMEEMLRPVTSARPLPERGKIQIDLSRAPLISIDLSGASSAC